MLYIYSLHNCPYSLASEKLAKKIKIPHEIIKVYTDSDKNKYKKIHGMKTFPQILFQNNNGELKIIGGHNEFLTLIDLCNKIKK
jgi:glutaredoxin